MGPATMGLPERPASGNDPAGRFARETSSEEVAAHRPDAAMPGPDERSAARRPSATVSTRATPQVAVGSSAAARASQPPEEKHSGRSRRGPSPGRCSLGRQLLARPSSHQPGTNSYSGGRRAAKRQQPAVARPRWSPIRHRPGKPPESRTSTDRPETARHNEDTDTVWSSEYHPLYVAATPPPDPLSYPFARPR